MAITKAYVKKGYVTFRQSDSGAALDGGFDLMRWFKGVADFLGIEYFDPCCDDATVFRPLRYNLTTGTTETFGNTGWAAASAGLTASAALNFPSIVNGATSTLTIALAGAVIGDTVLIGVPVTTPANTGFMFTGSVAAADVVTVTAFNGSGATVDIGSGTFSATILR